MNKVVFETVRQFVHGILTSAADRKWSLQGFGMLRTYISKELRLHVWSGKHAVPDVTTLHDHPWDFESVICAGQLYDQQWLPAYPAAEKAERFRCAQIVCGPGGGMSSEPDTIWLRPTVTHIMRAGQVYSHTREQIHSSSYADGTVSIIRRTFYPDTEHARVYFKDRWVSAEPRDAEPEEVREIVGKALEAWFTSGKEIS